MGEGGVGLASFEAKREMILSPCSAVREIQSTPRRFFNAEDAEVGAEERGDGFSLRPLREPSRPLRLIRLHGSLVAAPPRCVLSRLIENGGLFVANLSFSLIS